MNINRVTLTGNLTKDPEQRATPNGVTITTLRLAYSTRRKTSDGEWKAKPNYADITIFGAQAENARKYLTRGRGVAIDGRIEFHEWETNSGEKRTTTQIIAENVQYFPQPNKPAAVPVNTNEETVEDIPF